MRLTSERQTTGRRGDEMAASVFTAVFACVLCLCIPAGIAAQDSRNLEDASPDSIATTWLGVISKSEIDFTEGYRKAKSSLTWTYNAADWAFSSSMSIDKKKLRGRDQETLMESFLASGTRIVPNRYTLNVNMGDMYTQTTSAALSQFGKEIVMETQSTGFNLLSLMTVPGASASNFSLVGTASRGKQDFKYNKTVKMNASGHLVYEIGPHITVSGGGGSFVVREASDVGPFQFNGIRSNVDTLRTGIDIGSGEKKKFKLRYSRKMGKLRQIDPPLGNTMQIIDSPEDAKEEESRIKGEELLIESKVELRDGLLIEVNFDHTYSDQAYRVENRRNKESETNDIDASVSYRYHPKGSVSVSMARGESDTEFGPTSVASYRTKDYSMSVSVKHTFHDSLDILLRGSTSLDQKLYKKKEQNPRDADYTFSSLYGKMNAYLFRLIETTVTSTLSRRETINIDATLSGDNRVDYQYLFVPEYEFSPQTWLSLGQKYEIKIDYTEFSFDTDRNYLNRNTTLTTEVGIGLFRKLRYRIRHRYNMKDTGSYQSKIEGPRLYNPTSENIENRLTMNLDYEAFPGMTIFVRSNFRGQINNTLGVIDGMRRVTRTSGTESGDFRAGFKRKREFTGYGEVDLDIAWVKKFGPFISEENREYWVVSANVNFSF
ncbi:MAG: hypothetical protein KOO63_11130 [Bacteroidales bacterium]|nr:hypothetical protein [Candidatus Latescibacterota bacterium]